MAHPDLPPQDGTSRALLDRRGFLRSTAGGTAAIALAASLPAGAIAAYPAAVRDGVALRALSPKEYAVARAAAEAILVGVPVDAGAVAASIDAELAAVGDPIRSDMKTVFTLLEHLTPLSGRFRRFTALEPEARRHYLRGWSTSRFNLRRAVFQATRGFVCFFAYIQDETRPHTGFAGPWPELIDIPAYPVDFGEVT